MRAYITQCRPRSQEELRSFRDEPSLRSAVNRAGRATTPTGKRYNHQRRLPRGLLALAARELAQSDVGQAKSFDDLHERVAAIIGDLHGVGELMVYDTALRIGAKLSLLPTEVYLHAGTRAGARALGLNWRAKTLPVRELPSELQVLAPHEIEDCLCIFKHKLRAPTDLGL